ncbi:MAG: hypothetical protein AB1421_06285 [Pseudomonadota bacterium]
MIRQMAVMMMGAGFFLTGCDQLKERAGIPDPAKVEAEGKAIGSACRHAGWGIEDCFRLNPDASKPAMFTGWKDMNEYMIKNEMQAVPPTVGPDGSLPGMAKKKKKIIELEPIDKEAEKTEDKKAGHSEQTDKPEKSAAAEKNDKAAAH